MKYLPLTTILLLSCATISHAAVLINFDGAAGFVTSGINFGTSANSVITTTSVENDTVRSTIAYGSTIATNGVATYSGPTMRGGVYMNAIYSAAHTNAPQGNWGQLIESVNGDYIQLRRNGDGGALNTSTTSAVFTFEAPAGGPYGFDGTSSLSLTGGVGSATSDIGRWVVVSNGTTYISESTFNPHNSNSTTVYTISDPANTNWASWVPNSSLDNIPESFTVVGSNLDAITQAGFYFEKIGSTGINPTFRAFSADLAAIPEPATIAAISGFLGVIFVILRRRK